MDELKSVREKIKLAKQNQDVESQLKYLEQFQTIVISNGFPYGGKEIYRFVKYLEKLGMHERAAIERAKVEEAEFLLFDGYKQQRLQTIDSQSYFKHIKFISPFAEAPEECKKMNGLIEPIETSKCLAHYRACQNKPHCYCQISGFKPR